MAINNITEVIAAVDQEAFSDLQKFSDTQFQTILDLRTEILKIQSENKSLKLMLEANLPNLDLNIASIGISNEQLICETQIALLKEQAITRVLTIEEAKKLQTYVDVLLKVKKTFDVADIQVKKMSDDDLIKLVVDNEQRN